MVINAAEISEMGVSGKTQRSTANHNTAHDPFKFQARPFPVSLFQTPRSCALVEVKSCHGDVTIFV